MTRAKSPTSRAARQVGLCTCSACIAADPRRAALKKADTRALLLSMRHYHPGQRTNQP